jgi:hypothetical protein
MKNMKRILMIFVLGLFLASPIAWAQGYDVETPSSPASETGGPSLWNALKQGETKTVTREEGRTFQASAVDLSQVQAEVNNVKSGRVIQDDQTTKVYEKQFTDKTVSLSVDNEAIDVKLNGKVQLRINKLTNAETLSIESSVESDLPEHQKGRVLLKDKTVFIFQGLEIYQNTLYAGLSLDVCLSGCRLNNPPGYTCYREESRFSDSGTAKVCYQGSIINQKAKGEKCTAKVECQSNECISGKCSSTSEAIQEIQQEQKEQRGMLERIISFLKRFVGFK